MKKSNLIGWRIVGFLGVTIVVGLFFFRHQFGVKSVDKYSHEAISNNNNNNNNGSSDSGNRNEEFPTSVTNKPENAGQKLNELPAVTQNSNDENSKDNFLISLQKCAPEIATQAIATPETLFQYLQKSVGVNQRNTTVENYHLSLPDGSQRRVHIIPADNTNNANNNNRKEIRFFKLDAEGYPERIPLSGMETLSSLLSLGQVSKHEEKAQFRFRDGTTADVEFHDQMVFEFQYRNDRTILSCRYKDCRCQ